MGRGQQEVSGGWARETSSAAPHWSRYCPQPHPWKNSSIKLVLDAKKVGDLSLRQHLGIATGWTKVSCILWGYQLPILNSINLMLKDDAVVRIQLPMQETQETWVQPLGPEDPLEKEMAAHSSILAWKIPWMEEHGRLQSIGSQRAGHDWATSLSLMYS